MRKILWFITIITLLAATAFAGDWAQYRGPGMAGVTDDPNCPAKWDDASRVWKTDLPGNGVSQPIVKDGKIYVTAYSGYGENHQRDKDGSQKQENLRLHILCVNAADGKVIWHKELKPLGKVFPPESPITKHGYATPTPIYDEGTVYASFGSAGIFAVNAANGETLWTAQYGETCHRWGYAASLAICDDLLLYNGSTEVDAFIALDKKTGEEKWRTTEGLITTSKYNRSWATPQVVGNPEGGKQILLLNQNDLVSINPADGSTLWTFPTRQAYSSSNPVMKDGIIYAVTGSGHGQWQSYALKPEPGLSKDQRQIWHNKDNGTGFSSSVIVDDKIYYAAFTGKERPSSAKGYCCMDAKTGEMIYKENPDSELGHDYKRKIIYGAAVTNGKYIYYPVQIRLEDRSIVGSIFVVAAKPEFELLAINRFEDDTSQINAPVVPLGDGRLLIRTDQALHCVSGK